MRFLSPVLAVVTVVSAAAAAAADPVALNYHATDKSCPASPRFSDEVSAKLGYVPWDDQAPVAVRVRVTRDSDEFTGTIEQPDGTSKAMHGSTCDEVVDALVSALAVALDDTKGVVVGGVLANSGGDLRRLERALPSPRGDTVTVRLRPALGQSLHAVLQTAATDFYTGYGAVHFAQFRSLCEMPCVTEVPRGTLTLQIHDASNAMGAMAQAEVSGPSTLELHYVSKAGVRRSNNRKLAWGMVAGLVLGYAASAVIWEAAQGPDSALGNLHYFSFDIIAAPVGAGIGAWIGHALGDRDDQDAASIDVRRGLVDGPP